MGHSYGLALRHDVGRGDVRNEHSVLADGRDPPVVGHGENARLH